MSERSVKKENLFEESRYQYLLIKRDDELFSFSVANEILSQFFAVLIFCFFCIKTKEELENL